MNKFEKLATNERKSKFIEELDKIFKIKRQNNITMDHPSDNQNVHYSREQPSMNRLSTNDVILFRDSLVLTLISEAS